MDKVILDKLKDKPVLPEEIVLSISKKGVLTGSAVFGGLTDDSDLDYIMPSNFPYDWIELCKYGVVSNTNDYSNMELSSIYVRTKWDNILNLLFPTDIYYDIWINTTKIMADLVESNIELYNLTKKKKNRVALFETIKYMLSEEEHKPDKLEDFDVIL